ncbi:hypothetical protein SNE40_002369 [Patella caerulea]|uniref:G-protein coupled receptors family 1 profile domain-containing protein n=1 Tax=Patella caerulea TaxID=87958 RepID=A0AAN8KC23_PATCE
MLINNMWNNTVNISTDVLNNDVIYEEVVSKEVVQKLTVVFVMIFTPLFAFFGSLGNILSLVVLVQNRMRNPTNFLLAALAISDLLFLIHSFIFSFIFIYKSRDPIGGENLRRTTYPYIGAYGSIVTGRITTWLTTLLSFERFIAVRFPMRVRFLCRKQNTCIAIAVVYIVTLVAFVPFPLKYRIQYQPNSSLVILNRTALGYNLKFCAIYGTLLNILFRFLPILLLILLNIAIILAIKKTWNMRRLISKNSNHCTTYEQNRITMMLLTVSMVFLVCILPGALNSLATKVKPGYSIFGKQRNLYLSISCVTYFLETVNSAVNFIIYMAFSKKFYTTYKETFCCRTGSRVHKSSSKEIIRYKCRWQGSQSSSSGTHEGRLSSLLSNRTLIKKEQQQPICLLHNTGDIEICKFSCQKGERKDVNEKTERFS